MQTPYRPLRPARSETALVRGLRQHVWRWDPPAAASAPAPLVLVHGWMDVGASYQFLVDELARIEGDGRPIVALDWRGFGHSDGGGADAFWFPDYLGDLDALLDRLSTDAPVDLAGHSMGGNIAMNYAGVRPGRIRRLVNLEGFGLPDTRPEQSPARLAQWLDELKAPMTLRPYGSLDDVAAKLRRNNPRLAPDRATWLAAHWSEQREDGQWHVLGDAAHKRVNPFLYRAPEILAAWRSITAPVLWVEGRQTDVTRFWGDRYPRSEFEARLAQVPHKRQVVLEDCGHMVHLDQPAVLARALHEFLAG